MRGWFGPFRLERQVGRGGLGAVFRAVDSRTGATVALKMLAPGGDPSAARRLEREFDALRHLHHPNIVRVLDHGDEDGMPWLEMEYVDGMVLRDWLTIASEPQALEPEAEADAHGRAARRGAGTAAEGGDGHGGDAHRRGAGRAEPARAGGSAL